MTLGQFNKLNRMADRLEGIPQPDKSPTFYATMWFGLRPKLMGTHITQDQVAEITKERFNDAEDPAAILEEDTFVDGRKQITLRDKDRKVLIQYTQEKPDGTR